MIFFNKKKDGGGGAPFQDVNGNPITTQEMIERISNIRKKYFHDIEDIPQKIFDEIERRLTHPTREEREIKYELVKMEGKITELKNKLKYDINGFNGYCQLCEVPYFTPGNYYSQNQHHHIKYNRKERDRIKVFKLEERLFNVESRLKTLEEDLSSHKVEIIKDRIDSINKQQKKIIRDMKDLTEEETKEINDYLVGSIHTVFNAEDLSKIIEQQK